MSLDDMFCPMCESEDVNKEEDRNILNLAAGLSVGMAIGTVTKQYYLSGALGAVFYFLNVPLGPEINYDCGTCHYSWERD